MVMKKSARGSISRTFSRTKKYKEDEEYRGKQKEYIRKNYHKNRDKELAKKKKWIKKINEFAQKRCKICDKLLNYRTKSGFCRKHWREGLG